MTRESPSTLPAPAPAGPGRRMATVARMAVWCCSIVSIAGAGLVLSLDHAPTEEGRPELTARGHALVAPRLAAMDTEVQRLATAGDAMAAAGRDTLTRLRALDVADSEAALDAGDMAIDRRLGASRERLAAARATLLDGTSLTALPTSDRLRIGTIDAAIAAAGELPGYWEAGRGRRRRIRWTCSRPWQAHDAQVRRGDRFRARAAKWADALSALQDAQRLLVAGARGPRGRPQGRSRRLHPRRPARSRRRLRRGARRTSTPASGHPTARRPRSHGRHWNA